jgi:predicted dehydrogenase
MSPSGTVRVGFLGAGFIATYHGKSLRRSGADHHIAAVYDVDPGRAEAFAAASGATAVGSEEELFEAVDAVYVCTWTSEHPRLVAAAVERDLPVFCEKPLATDLASATVLVDGVLGAGVVNRAGLVLRSYPAMLELRHQLADPRNGRVQALVFRDDQYLPVQGGYGSTWRADPARAGAGTLLEHSIHDVDLIEWLLGPIVSLTARTATFHGQHPIDDTTTVGFELASGAQASLTSVWHQLLARESSRRIEVLCEHTILTVEDDVFGPVTWTRSDGDSGSLWAEELFDTVAARNAGRLHNQDRAFIEAVASGAVAPEGDDPDVVVALRAHQIVDAAYRSAAEGAAPVEVRPKP